MKRPCALKGVKPRGLRGSDISLWYAWHFSVFISFYRRELFDISGGQRVVITQCVAEGEKVTLCSFSD